MSEYHIRYGGYGGIGYYLVSDLYIALFSRFTTCVSWEGHHILDFIQENTSDIQPDTTHADTQGQSTAIFGLAHLLGIQLQPRIRNWKDLHFFRPDPRVRYKHIDLLFTKQVDWDLIETILPEMFRVALSIGAGRIRPSTILQRLATCTHSKAQVIAEALTKVSGFLKRIKATAEQLTQAARWRLILSAAFQYFLRGKVLGSTGRLVAATG
jgi:TnpA family transposase